MAAQTVLTPSHDRVDGTIPDSVRQAISWRSRLDTGVIGCAAVLLVALLQAWLGIRAGLTNPFLHFDVAYVAGTTGKSHLLYPKGGPFASLSYVPGREVAMSMLYRVAGFDDPARFQFLPLGIVLISLCYYLLLFRVAGSALLATLTTIALLLDPSHFQGIYSMFAYALAFPLYLTFLLIFLTTFSKRTPSSLIALTLIFGAVYFIHYTVTTWIIGIAFVSSVLAIIAQRMQGVRQRSRVLATIGIGNLALAMICFYVFFNRALYESFAPFAGRGSAVEALVNFRTRLPFLSSRITAGPFDYVQPHIVSLISTLHLGLLLLLVILGFGAIGIQQLMRRGCPLSLPVVIVSIGFLASAVVDIAAYTSRGDVSTKFLSLAFPLLVSVLLAQALGWRGATVVAIGLSMVVGVKLWVAWDEGYFSTVPSGYEAVEPGLSWAIDHTSGSVDVTSGLDTYGKLLVIGAEKGRVFAYHPLSDGIYAAILDRDATKTVPAAATACQCSVIVADIASSAPLDGLFWARLKPWSSNRAALATTQSVDRVYDDGTIWILLPRAEKGKQE